MPQYHVGHVELVDSIEQQIAALPNLEPATLIEELGFHSVFAVEFRRPETLFTPSQLINFSGQNKIVFA